MKCLYQGCECRYVDTSGMHQLKPCSECELNEPKGVRISRGCAEPAVAILIILILLLI